MDPIILLDQVDNVAGVWFQNSNFSSEIFPLFCDILQREMKCIIILTEVKYVSNKVSTLRKLSEIIKLRYKSIYIKIRYKLYSKSIERERKTKHLINGYIFISNSKYGDNFALL